jgi:major type 1 subunit fimbrin (pilin)
MNKRVTGLLLGLLSSACWGKADIGSPGDLHFTLSIRQGTCELQERDLSIDMGEVKHPGRLSPGQTLVSKAFSLVMLNCADATKAKVTMDGVADANDSDFFAVDEGGAKGVAIKIVDENGVVQKPRTTDPTAHSFAVTPSGGMVSLDYTASYVTTASSVSSGSANALLTFSIEYE